MAAGSQASFTAQLSSTRRRFKCIINFEFKMIAEPNFVIHLFELIILFIFVFILLFTIIGQAKLSFPW